MLKTYTVGELIRELQRAVIVDDLDVSSEILTADLELAHFEIVRPISPEYVNVHGHVIVS